MLGCNNDNKLEHRSSLKRVSTKLSVLKFCKDTRFTDNLMDEECTKESINKVLTDSKITNNTI